MERIKLNDFTRNLTVTGALQPQRDAELVITIIMDQY